MSPRLSTVVASRIKQLLSKCDIRLLHETREGSRRRRDRGVREQQHFAPEFPVIVKNDAVETVPSVLEEKMGENSSERIEESPVRK